MRCKRLISEICVISMISIMISADIMNNNIYGVSEEKIGSSSKFGSSLDIGSSNMFVIDGGTEERDFTYETGVLKVISDTPMTIKNQNLGQSTTDRIVIRKNVNVDITLAGVKIDVSEMENTAALKIEDDSSGNVTITLAEGTTNILKSGKNCAGLQKNGGNESIGGLTMKGKGRLIAAGGEYGAGIGGGILGTGRNITISGGKVTAKGGKYGAGIGGGCGGSGDVIEISGGEVKATGGDYGAGIGGGEKETGVDIIISEKAAVTAKGGKTE